MAKTNFKDGKTIITPEYLNKVFGGNPASTNDYEVLGHKHDGGTEDGSASKIDLGNHVQGTLHGSYLQDNTVVFEKLVAQSDPENAIPVTTTDGSGTYYYINPNTIAAGEEGDVQFAGISGELAANTSFKVASNSSDFILNVGSTSNLNGFINVVSGRLSLEESQLRMTGLSQGEVTFDVHPDQTVDIGYILPKRTAINGYLKYNPLGILTWDTINLSVGGTVTVPASSGSNGVVQLSDGSGGFISRENVLLDSENFLSVGGTQGGLTATGIKVQNGSVVRFENENSFYADVKFPEETCEETIDLTNGNKTLLLPAMGDDVTPGAALYLLSTANNSFQLSFNKVLDPGFTVVNSCTAPHVLVELPDGFTGVVAGGDFAFADTNNDAGLIVQTDPILSEVSFDVVTSSGYQTMSFAAPTVKIESDEFIIDGGSSAGKLDLYDLDSSEKITIKAADTIISSFELTLPTSDGAAGQFISTDGNGQLSFQSAAGGLAEIVDDSTPQLGGDLDAQNNSILAVDYFGLNTSTLLTTPGVGEIAWNADESTLNVGDGSTVLQVGQEIHYNVRNNTGSAIPNGTAVMATGTLGSSGRITVAPATADGSVSQIFYIGVTTEDIADGADGKVTHFGKVRGVDTSSYSDGDVLWLDPSTSGGFTSTEPSAPNLKIAAAFVINSHATNGTIAVRTNAGSRLADQHDVEISAPINGQVLSYNSATGVWENASPSSGGAPVDSEYLVLSQDSALSNERVFSPNPADFSLVQTTGTYSLSLASDVMRALSDDTSPTLSAALDADGNNISMGAGEITFFDGAERIYSNGTSLRFMVNNGNELYLSATALYPAVNGGLALGTTAGQFTTGYLGSVNLCDSVTNRITIEPPALSASYTLTLPVDDGNVGEVLVTDGSGNLSWTAPSASGETLKTTTTLTSVDGSIIGSDWVYTVQSSEVSNHVYAIDSNAIGNKIGGTNEIFVQVQDDANWEDGFYFTVVNDGSATLTVRAENTAASTYIDQPINATNSTFTLGGVPLDGGKVATFVLSGSGSAKTVYRIG